MVCGCRLKAVAGALLGLDVRPESATSGDMGMEQVRAAARLVGLSCRM